MSLRADCIAFDANDPVALGQWWAELLGGRYEVDEDGDVLVHVEVATPLAFFGVPEGEAVKNRLHLDLRLATGGGGRCPGLARCGRG